MARLEECLDPRHAGRSGASSGGSRQHTAGWFPEMPRPMSLVRPPGDHHPGPRTRAVRRLRRQSGTLLSARLNDPTLERH